MRTLGTLVNVLARLTIAIVPIITSAGVTAYSVGTSGMSAATVLGADSTLVNVRAGMTVAMVPIITSTGVTACSVGTSGMSAATVLGADSTLVNIRAGMTVAMVPIMTNADAVYERCRSANQVSVFVAVTDGSTWVRHGTTITIPAGVTCARVGSTYVVVTRSVGTTTVIAIGTLVDIVASGTNQFVMATVAVARLALIVIPAC